MTLGRPTETQLEATGHTGQPPGAQSMVDKGVGMAEDANDRCLAILGTTQRKSDSIVLGWGLGIFPKFFTYISDTHPDMALHYKM